MDNPTPIRSADAGPASSAWLQFPRRAVLLLIAYGLCLLLLMALRSSLGGGLVEDWSVSSTSRLPVSDLIGERLPTSLGLVVLALFLASGLAVIGTALGLGLRRLGVGQP
jgi:ABC-type dipeptide/oligopeptide/nickel transport system permease component